MHFKDHQHHAKRWLFREKKRLVKALLGCQVMADRDGRKSVLHELRVEIKESIRYIGADRHDVLNIVSVCLQHEGGIEELVDIVHFFENRSIGYENLEETIEDILTPGIIRKEQRDELLDIVSGVTVPSEILLKLYRECLPLGKSIEAYTPQLILRQLAQLPRQAGGAFPYPILEFALRLGLAIDDEQVRERIDAWVEARAKELRVSRRLTALRYDLTRNSKSASSHSKLYLLIELEPDVVDKHRETTDNTRYIVRAWLFGDHIETEITHSRDLYTLDQMPSLIENELLEEVHRTYKYQKLTVEFLLPNDLICYDFENWELEDGDPIGFHYPVVVRLQARSQLHRYQTFWLRCWQNVKLWQVVSTHSVMWCHTVTTEAWRTVLAKLKPAHMVCLALALMPPRGSGPQRDLLSILVRSGTPIAIWPRLQKPENVEEVLRELKALLTHDALEKWPDLVHKKRIQAWEKNEHQGFSRHNLTLLWDDPTRLPLKVQRRGLAGET